MGKGGNELVISRWRRFGFFCLLMYWVILVNLTLFTYNHYVYGRSYNLALFQSIRLMWDSGDFQLMFKNIIGNVLLFFPQGLLLPLLFHRCRNFFLLFVICLGSSFLIESLQYGFAERIFDIDDVFLNTAGAMMGWLAMVGLIRPFRKAEG